MKSTLYTWAAALLTLSPSLAAPLNDVPFRSAAPIRENGKYIVKRQTGEFANHVTFAFNQSSSLPQGLSASNYPVASTPRAHNFSPSNVAVSNGYMQITVPGGQNSGSIGCGEVTTTVNNILYASVRTVAVLSDPAGVCNGMFYYKSDTQESDIEWLSDPNSTSNQGTRKLWLTNQATTAGGQKSDTSVAPPSDATTNEHEYRIDWTEGLTVFYVDGVEQWRTTTDVPNTPGSWIWNNWSNGDPGWSAGPPQQDAVFKISSIDMYYNTA